MDHRYAPLLPLALIASASFAQTPFEHADQRTFSVSYGSCAAFGDGWVVAGIITDDDGSMQYDILRAFDAAGEPLWEATHQAGSLQAYTQAMATLQDDDLITASNLVGCDVLLPSFLVQRRNVNGDTTWSKTFAFPYVGGMAVNQGDSLAFSTDMGVLLVNADGDSLTSFPTAGYGASLLAWDISSTLLLNNGGAGLSRWSLSGTLLAQTELQQNVIDVLWWQGHRIALTSDGWLRTFDADLNALDSLAIGPPSSYRRLLPIDDQLIVADNTISGVLDNTLAIVGSIGMDPAGEFPDDLFRTFAANDNAILQVATATTAQRPAGLVRSVALDGTFTGHAENVRIEMHSIDNTYYYVQNGLVFPLADVTVRVTNKGIPVLNQVMISHATMFGTLCGSVGTSIALDSLGLVINDYIDIPLTGLQLNYAPWGSVNLHQAVCIGALSPNNLYDRDQSDNYACDTAHIVLTIPDLGIDGSGILVANPFSDAIDMFFTTLTSEPLGAVLFDATGRQLAVATIIAGSARFRWSLPDLSDGVHILRIEGRSTSIARKLVHQQP